jgi:hypothetical protein
MRAIFHIGDLVILKAIFTDPDTKEPVDPETVVCTVQRGSTISTPEVTGEKGVYTAEVEIDRSGRWYFAFDGTGGHQASQEGSFSVRQQAIPRS